MAAPQVAVFNLKRFALLCLVDAVVILGTRKHTHTHTLTLFFFSFFLKLKLTSVSAFHKVTPLQPFLFNAFPIGNHRFARTNGGRPGARPHRVAIKTA